MEKGYNTHSSILRPPWWLRPQRILLQCSRPGFDPSVGKIPWRRAWQPTPVFLPEESLWTEEPADYSPRGHKESDIAEQQAQHSTDIQGLDIERVETSTNRPVVFERNRWFPKPLHSVESKRPSRWPCRPGLFE